MASKFFKSNPTAIVNGVRSGSGRVLAKTNGSVSIGNIARISTGSAVDSSCSPPRSSSDSHNDNKRNKFCIKPAVDPTAKRDWPDSRLGCFNPDPDCAPLPGHLGLTKQTWETEPKGTDSLSPAGFVRMLQKTSAAEQTLDLKVGALPEKAKPKEPEVKPQTPVQVYTSLSAAESSIVWQSLPKPAASVTGNAIHKQIFDTVANRRNSLQQSTTLPPSAPASRNTMSSLLPTVCVHRIPDKAFLDFQALFPERTLCKDNLCAVTLAYKTTNDMGSWSPKVFEERERLTSHFVTNATAFCERIKTMNELSSDLWCDFIDPTSGLAFFAPYSPSPLHETNPVMVDFGFDIEDLGCCKVLKHKQWGTHLFVGTIVVAAPANSRIVADSVAVTLQQLAELATEKTKETASDVDGVKS